MQSHSPSPYAGFIQFLQVNSQGDSCGGSVFDLLGGYFCAVLGDDIYVQGLLDLIFYLLKQQYPLFPFIVGPVPASPIRRPPSALGPPACQGPFAAVHYSRPVQCAAPGGRLPVLRA